MQTLAIVQVNTSLGVFRLSVSQDEDNLISERCGSQLPHLFPVRVGKRMIRPRTLNHDASKLLEEAIIEVEGFAEIREARAVELS